MEQKKISILEALKFAGHQFIDNFIFFFLLYLTIIGLVIVGFLGLALLIGGISLIHQNSFVEQQLIYIRQFAEQPESVKIISSQLPWNLCLILLAFAVASAAYGMLITLGMKKIAFNIYDHQTTRVRIIFSCWHLIFKGLLASFLFYTMTSLGFAFFVIPGIYCAATYGFYLFVLVDKNNGVLEAFKESARLTKNSRLLLCALVTAFLVIKPFTLGVGFLLLYPIELLTYVYIYRKLQNQLLSEQFKPFPNF